MAERNPPTDATVVELLPSAMVKVKLDSGEEVAAHVAEEFRRVSTPVKPGDRVRVRRAERDPNRGTIIGRLV
jgi:translation initiation factor IF-1